MTRPILRSVALAVLLLSPLAARAGTAPRTELVKTGSGWELRRDGKPYLIRGAGGSGPMPMLKELGGNSVRTWNADDIGPLLDEAHRLGMTVTVGIWLKHERHGFDYNDASFVAEQFERVRAQVERYRDHPAVLMWALGNEMEGKEGDDAAIWSHVEAAAALVKRLDPTRPTLTVTAEIGGDRVKNIHRLCPSIDIVGVNTYAGASSIVERYKAAGGTKPLLLTEFGPFGTWEVERDELGLLPEPTGNQKAEQYRKHYAATVVDGKDLVLGSYAFTWGHKLEMTQTWFGMLLPDGSKLPSVDAMAELWTGTPPANRCPQVEPIVLDTTRRVKPGQAIAARVTASDPDGDPLSYEWVLKGEVAKPGIGGDPEKAPPVFKDATRSAPGAEVSIVAPTEPGRYRLYVYIRDGKGSATTANVPFLVAADGAE